MAATDTKGSEMSAAPFGDCAKVVADPDGPAGESRSISLNLEQTKRERTVKKEACCYSWFIPCPGGRPVTVGGVPRVSDETGDDHWLGETSESDTWQALRASMQWPSSDECDALARHYAREAAYEHASIASFARVSLSLLAVGAPPDLVGETHRAALDEIDHASTMYRLGSAFRGEALGPGALDLADAPPPSTRLDEIAREALFEGCVGEVAAALVLREEANRAPNALMARMLDAMAADEERHAELAFRTLAWAVAQSPAIVGAAIETALGQLVDESTRHIPAETTRAALPFVTTAVERASLRQRAIAEVTLPCLRRCSLAALDLAPFPEGLVRLQPSQSPTCPFCARRPGARAASFAFSVLMPWCE